MKDGAVSFLALAIFFFVVAVVYLADAGIHNRKQGIIGFAAMSCVCSLFSLVTSRCSLHRYREAEELRLELMGPVPEAEAEEKVPEIHVSGLRGGHRAGGAVVDSLKGS